MMLTTGARRSAGASISIVFPFALARAASSTRSR